MDILLGETILKRYAQGYFITTTTRTTYGSLKGGMEVTCWVFLVRGNPGMVGGLLLIIFPFYFVPPQDLSIFTPLSGNR